MAVADKSSQKIPNGGLLRGAAGIALLAISAAAAAGVLPNARVNDLVDDLPRMDQATTSVAVDPTNPLRLVVGFEDCRGGFRPSRQGVSGWGFSANGGETWTGIETGVPKADPADLGTRGQPSIDVDEAGNFYYSNLYFRAGYSTLNVSVHRGRFVKDGFIWDLPTFATDFTSGFGPDSGHLGVDKRPGSETLYVSYTNFSASPRRIEVVRSTDGGKTWSEPVALASGDVQGSMPRVGPDGEVHVAWATWPGSPRTIRVRKSVKWPDFEAEVLATTMVPAANPPFNSRYPQFPAMDIDRTDGPDRGRVYITFGDGRLGGAAAIGTIFLIHSSDGAKWSDPIQLDDDPEPPSVSRTHRWFSWPAVDDRGVVHVGWYDRRLRGANEALTDVFGTRFRVDVGPSENVRVTDQSFRMNVLGECRCPLCDHNSESHLGAAVGPTRFHFAWSDGREGNPDIYAGGVVITRILVDPTATEVCPGDSVTTTLTAFGGIGFFQEDVSLSLLEVSPPEPSIGATFEPNPVPRPPLEGSPSTMTINTTKKTPPGTYVLTVEGTDGDRTGRAEVTLTVLKCSRPSLARSNGALGHVKTRP